MKITEKRWTRNFQIERPIKPQPGNEQRDQHRKGELFFRIFHSSSSTLVLTSSVLGQIHTKSSDPERGVGSDQAAVMADQFADSAVSLEFFLP